MTTNKQSFYAVLGRRIAERRKALGITQVQLAETLGIAQQTMAHYEGGVSRIAVETLTQLAVALQTNVEELIGTQTKHRAGKRGPAPRIQQQLERVSQLPRARQRMVSEVLDSLLATHQ
ncbi:MAG TPA: helix-turn-helix transcriptional regulator [Rhodanobacteraceae bacterium]|nr:helix-turn-helix transcriptional regulator [Rhodanobacteraceae bacterium]